MTEFAQPDQEVMTDYPALTPLDEYPLHGWDYGSPYACQGHPGTYDWRCPDCVAVAAHEVERGRDVVVRWRQSAVHNEQNVTLKWLVGRSHHHGVSRHSKETP